MTQPEEALQAAPKPGRAAAKAARRQDLIEATIDSVARFGLTGTTIARVTEAAGTSIGLANFHFDSKERLLEATLQYLADEQRALWQNCNLDGARSSAEQLMAIVDSRFHPRICERRKLAVWFAFYGDAGARDIYRRVLSDVDDERLYATAAILTAMCAETDRTGIDPLETALGMEALYDGLWLNMLLYPEDFKRLSCRKHAIEFIAARFPAQFVGHHPT